MQYSHEHGGHGNVWVFPRSLLMLQNTVPCFSIHDGMQSCFQKQKLKPCSPLTSYSVMDLQNSKDNVRLRRILESPTYLCFPLAQNRVWSRCSRRGDIAVFLHLRITAGVEYSAANFDCIHPNKVLEIFVPGHLKLLLTDWTRCVR